MAMFSTYIAWQPMVWGMPWYVAFPIAIAISFVGGFAVERVVFKPIQNAPVLSHIVIFIALFSIFNSLAGFIWDFTIKNVASPCGEGPFMGSTLLGKHQAGMIIVTILMLVALWAFFAFTRVGLAMRAAAANPESARLVGIRVATMTALGWGMAAGIGAVAGILIAPVVFLEPNMMLSILLYGFAGAVLGGLTNPLGAVIGGFIVGIVENLAGTYLGEVGAELKLSIALVLIIIVLVVKPEGILGRKIVQRV